MWFVNRFLRIYECCPYEGGGNSTILTLTLVQNLTLTPTLNACGVLMLVISAIDLTATLALTPICRVRVRVSVRYICHGRARLRARVGERVFNDNSSA